MQMVETCPEAGFSKSSSHAGVSSFVPNNTGQKAVAFTGAKTWPYTFTIAGVHLLFFRPLVVCLEEIGKG